MINKQKNLILICFAYAKVCVFLLFWAIVLPGCLSWTAVVNHTSAQSIGSTSKGLLLGNVHLPRKSLHYRTYKQRDRRYTTLQMKQLIESSAASVAKAYPGSVLLVGDISGKGGGKISEHSSHRSGRDVDFAFFATDVLGYTALEAPIVEFDRFGIGLCHSRVCRFDTKRNWALVEALIGNTQTEVQWIFVSNGLKATLLEYALAQEKDIDIILKASSVLHQPSDSAVHDDHFHVRIYCPKGSEGAACADRKPIWTWHQEENSRLKEPSDSSLIKMALDGFAEYQTHEVL